MAGENILVIDDDQQILMVLQQYLEMEYDYTVTTADSAMDGLAHLAQQHYALVISDINMPGMSGLELVMRVRGSYPEMKIIIMSTEGTTDNIVAAIRNGADDFIHKPFDLVNDGNKIQEMVQKSQQVIPHYEPKLLYETVGDYTLLKQMGAGGMGIVYKARQQSTGDVVAIKIMFPSVMQKKESYERFLREARLMSRLRHPNIVQALDVGRVNNKCFIAMEFVDGPTLEDKIEQNGALVLEDAIPLIRDMFDALEYINHKKMVHRDIKPANLLIAKSGILKVADLGLSRRADDSSLTKTGHIMGTAGYMPPEAIFTEDDPDIRTDIYAVGATVFFILTGEHPFLGKSSAIFDRQRSEVPSIRSLNPEISDGLDKFIKKAMAIKPEERFQTPQEMEQHFFGLDLA